MAHTFSRNHVHIIFSTKDRRTTIAKDLQPPLWAYLAGICKHHDMIAHAVGGTENHLHISEQAKGFSWQEGYGAFSVSASNLDQVIYIQNQEAHHRKINFEEEFRKLLRRHGVEYDPKYVLG